MQSPPLYLLLYAVYIVRLTLYKQVGFRTGLDRLKDLLPSFEPPFSGRQPCRFGYRLSPIRRPFLVCNYQQGGDIRDDQYVQEIYRV